MPLGQIGQLLGQTKVARLHADYPEHQLQDTYLPRLRLVWRITPRPLCLRGRSQITLYSFYARTVLLSIESVLNVGNLQ
jgi:hypothetical protein